MAKNVQINGVDYPSVASVKLPLTADLQAFAFFYDTDSGDAAAGDLRNGKKSMGRWCRGSVMSRLRVVQTSQ